MGIKYLAEDIQNTIEEGSSFYEEKMYKELIEAIDNLKKSCELKRKEVLEGEF